MRIDDIITISLALRCAADYISPRDIRTHQKHGTGVKSKQREKLVLDRDRSGFNMEMMASRQHTLLYS